LEDRAGSGVVTMKVLARLVWTHHRAALRSQERPTVAAAKSEHSRCFPITVAFARFVNILRQLNGVVAGMLQIYRQQFLLYNALGDAPWLCVRTVARLHLWHIFSASKSFAIF
jgi:membrane protein DedA with SNARE-associated domain